MTALPLPGSGTGGERAEWVAGTTHTFTGLRPQTLYTVAVRGYTIAGPGEKRNISVATEAIRKSASHRKSRSVFVSHHNLQLVYLGNTHNQSSIIIARIIVV